MLALPCCRRGGSVGWGGEGTEGASALGQRSPPSQRRPQREGGACGACPLLTWWPLAGVAFVPWVGTVAAARRGYLGPPRCDQKHRGTTPAPPPPPPPNTQMG